MSRSSFENSTWIPYTTNPRELAKNLQKGFNRLCEQADQEGYSGEINTKDR